MKLFHKLRLLRKKWDGTFIEKPARCPECNKKAQGITSFLYTNGMNTGYARYKMGWYCVLCGYHEFLYKVPEIKEAI